MRFQEQLLKKLRPGGQRPRVWGIDLGTTNSTISEISDDLDARPIEIKQPTKDAPQVSPIIPSVVAVLQDEVWVGEGAKRLRARPQDHKLEAMQSIFFETKNEMGLNRTYLNAPPALNAPWTIARTILKFIRDEVEATHGGVAQRVVVTVPASFLANQREDTIRAAKYAGFELADNDLLDEPTAALIDYLMTDAEALEGRGLKATSNVMVFDFGGGTCDISIIRLSEKDGVMSGTKLATSRYHRLGGGDIDAAIVHNVLIPQLLSQNGISPESLDYTTKKRKLEPQLLGTAERLKIALCSEITRLKAFNKYYDSKDSLVAKQPSVECFLGTDKWVIDRPSLTPGQFDDIMEEFLDIDRLYSRETEYRIVQSIFAPLTDALDRAQLRPSDVDLVLLAGGSALIPHVEEAIKEFVGGGKVHRYRDGLDLQLAISRGAAWHAFALEVLGRPLIKPTLSAGFALLTGRDSQPFQLVPPGVDLPYPPPDMEEDEKYVKSLFVPEGASRALKLDLVTQPDGQVVFSETWSLEKRPKAYDQINIRAKVDGNQNLTIEATLKDHPDMRFERTKANPLINVANPNSAKVAILEKEEAIRRKGGFASTTVESMVELANLYSELGQYEKAAELIKAALRKRNAADPWLLNLQGIYLHNAGLVDRALKSYSEAAKADAYEGSARFNGALLLSNQKRPEEALQWIDLALDAEPDCPAYHVLRARILNQLGRADDANQALETAEGLIESPEDLSDWELGWCLEGAKKSGNHRLEKELSEERTRRSKKGKVEDSSDALRPLAAPGVDF